MWDLCGGVRDSEQAGSVVLAQGLSRPVARGILVPQLGIKPTLSVLEAQSVNHWMVTEVPNRPFLKYFIYVDFADLNI